MTDPFNSNPFGNAEKPQSDSNSKLFVSPENSKTFHVDSSRQDSPRRSSSRPTISARRELRLKHSVVRRNVLIAVAILIGLVLALISTDVIKLGTGPKPTFSEQSRSLTVPTQRAIVAGEQLESIRELTGKDPLRVYIGGDSLVGSFGRELAENLGDTGVIKATYDSRPSSGLVNTDFFNWNKHIKSIKQTYKPEILFFMIGTNDASIASSNPGGYQQAYRQKLLSFLDAASTADTRIVFVLAPAMKETALDKNLKKINKVILEVAKEEGIRVVDTGDVLSPNRSYSSTVRYNNKSITIRADDGVHINANGGELIASQLRNFLFSTFDIGEFSSEIAIKPVKVPGCCKSPTSVPSGTSQTSSTSSSSPQTNSSTSSTSSTSTTSPTTTEPETNE